MLRELAHTRQIPGDYFRRCFSDENLDLVIWYKANKRLHGFQLTYDCAHRPRTLTWTEARGYSHDKVDAGESNPMFNRTPTLSHDSDFDGAKVIADYQASSEILPTPIRDLIRRKIEIFARLKRTPHWAHVLVALAGGFGVGVGVFTLAMILTDRDHPLPAA